MLTTEVMITDLPEEKGADGSVYTMKTTLDIDDALLKKVMETSKSRTKKGAIETALQEYLQLRKRQDIERPDRQLPGFRPHPGRFEENTSCTVRAEWCIRRLENAMSRVKT